MCSMNTEKFSDMVHILDVQFDEVLWEVKQLYHSMVANFGAGLSIPLFPFPYMHRAREIAHPPPNIPSPPPWHIQVHQLLLLPLKLLPGWSLCPALAVTEVTLVREKQAASTNPHC
jgi:hypothetical protein